MKFKHRKMSQFSLRLFKANGDSHTNKQVGMFVPQGGHHAYIGEFDNIDSAHCLLQIYPADPSKHTFYTLNDKTMFVYCRTHTPAAFVLCGSICNVDEYVYFKPPINTTGVFVILAVTETEATDELINIDAIV